MSSALIKGTIDSSKFCIMATIPKPVPRIASLFKNIGIEGIIIVAKVVKQTPKSTNGNVEEAHLSHSGRIT